MLNGWSRSKKRERLRQKHAGLACGHFHGWEPYEIEGLEKRLLLTNSLQLYWNSILESMKSNISSPSYQLVMNAENEPFSSSSPYGLTPAEIRAAYGFNNVTFGSIIGDGTGQTIAIIDAYDNPNIASDLAAFDAYFGIPDPPSFTKLAQDGSTNYPAAATVGSWALEIALDVEWAHALAPGANIVLIEANSASDYDLINTAVTYAKSLANVSVISMSFGRAETSNDAILNSIFTTSSGHTGITYVASSGDYGYYNSSLKTTIGVEYPSASPNVLAVGGTYLTLENGAYGSETAWSSSGGGYSSYETQSVYQSGVITSTYRTTPDVSFNGATSSGVAVYDSYDYGSSTPWVQVGGTSFSAPAWAAIIAIANQGRALAGLGTLYGVADTLTSLYSMSSSNFNDITSGSNGYSASQGYDLVTGLGSPKVDLVVSALSSASATPTSVSLMAESDTGASSSDLLTSLNNSSSTKTLKFLVSGTVAGATVYVYADGTLIGSAVATGVQTIITTNGTVTLSNGSRVITARQIESGKGISSTTSSLTITIDSKAPTVVSQSPTSTTVRTTAVSSMTITFSEAMDTVNFSIANNIDSFTNLTGNILNMITGFSWSTNGKALTLNFISLTTAGTYTLLLNTKTEDAAGNGLATEYLAVFKLYAKNSTGTTYILPTAAITGQIYLDANSNGIYDSGDSGISGITVYQDATSSGSYITSDASTTTTATGEYTLYLGVGARNVVRAIISATTYVISTSAGQTAAESTTNPLLLTDLALFPKIFTGTSGNDSFLLRRNATTGNLEIVQTLSGASTSTYSISYNLLPSLTINGGAGADTFTLDFTNGSPISSTQLIISGEGDANILNLQGGINSATASNFTINTTQIIADGLTVSYSNMQTVAISGNLKSGSNIPNLTVTGVTVQVLSTLTVGALTLNTGGLVQLSGTNASMELSSLIFNGGILDVMAHSILLHNGDMAGVRSALASGYQGGAWTGVGLISSTARSVANKALGYLSGIDYIAIKGSATWGSTMVVSTDIVIAYTSEGDTDLSGAVGTQDFIQIDQSYLSQQTTNVFWANGDFNYDGVIDSTDFQLLHNALINA